MIDLERLYGYKHEFEREEFEIKAQIADLERQLVFVRAEISVVDRMIVDEEKEVKRCGVENVPEYVAPANDDTDAIEINEQENTGVVVNEYFTTPTEE